MGSFGQFGLIGGARRDMVVNLEVAAQFFRKLFVEKGSPLSYPLGLFSTLNVDRNGKAKLIEIGTPRHVLQKFTNCTTWNPKGRMDLQTGEINTAHIEFMGTQCADSWLGGCLEQILPLGADVWDFRATPEGRAMFNAMVAGVYSALGNSINDLVMYAGNSLITSSDTNSWWDNSTITTKEWEEFIDQQTNIEMSGIYTLIDDLKAASNPQYTVDISSYYNADGSFNTSTDVTALFDSVLGAATGELNVALRRQAGEISTAILVDGTTFDAYKKYIIGTYSAIPQGYLMEQNGEAVRGVLMYDGKPVIVDDSIEMMSSYIGVEQRRCIVTALGNFAVARRQEAIPDMYDGAGLVVQQSDLLRDKGRLDMYSAFRLNTAIADTRFMVSGEHTVTP